MEDLFDIPDDDEEESVVVKGAGSIAQKLDEAWAIWVELTKRPDGKTVEQKFRKAYVGMLKQNWDHIAMLRIIRGAARMEPRPRDSADTRRAIMPLTNYNHEAVALNLLSENAPIIEYRHPDMTQTKSSIEDVERSCDSLLSEWTETDVEAAGILIQKMTGVELEDAGDRIALHIGRDVLSPMDILRYHKVLDSLRSTAKNGRDSYGAGKKELSQTEAINFGADVFATRMLMKGRKIADIARVHAMAPVGYWDEVTNRLAEENDLASIYDDLESTYSWHPNERTR